MEEIWGLKENIGKRQQSRQTCRISFVCSFAHSMMIQRLISSHALNLGELLDRIEYLDKVVNLRISKHCSCSPLYRDIHICFNLVKVCFSLKCLNIIVYNGNGDNNVWNEQTKACVLVPLLIYVSWWVRTHRTQWNHTGSAKNVFRCFARGHNKIESIWCSEDTDSWFVCQSQ